MEFYEADPALENYWRGVILFGRNSASYKFALGKSLIDLATSPNDLIKLDDLAVPFSKHICEHLDLADKQGSSSGSKFLKTCRSFNNGEMSQSDLIAATSKLGFVNVIDAFHNVNGEEISKRFFIDERKSNGGIRVTDSLFELFSEKDQHDLYDETESRWRLVETAWELNLSKHLITVQADESGEILFTNNDNRRIDITSSRGALNGYQKGKCFYCFDSIGIVSGSDDLADVDHFLPHTLMSNGAGDNLNGVWNLVLACKDCNRGVGGKSARIPDISLLARLHKRNEYLITSHHPLRETLISQTGANEINRRDYLQHRYNRAKEILIHTWIPDPKAPETF
ncbi:MAG TPA: HNH endonuclease [Methylophaga aminisulfidivorans]|uniref:HNH endonuclease n=1 Tax=Methylophaga aminisulfidivorans TaxID=230105 RepID=A0A7C1ZV69_9GAMM|nr:HNH endonuclease [Methylophaga aminisulfidivorans]